MRNISASVGFRFVAESNYGMFPLLLGQNEVRTKMPANFP